MSRLLDPKILMAIKDLPLAAKTTIDGFMEGLNRSKLKGQGMEFSQYRSYQPGDDLRMLDWKMFARSDRYYVRESEVETNISVRFLIDASNSMQHEDSGYSKMEYARYIAASLAYLASLQNDAVGLFILQNRSFFSLSAKRDKQHLARFYHQLEKTEPSGSFGEAVHYATLFGGSNKRELLVFITDFYERDGEITKVLESLSMLKHEILVLHIMGKNEMELDYKGYSALEDLETGEKIAFGGEAKKQYQQRLNERLIQIRDRLLQKNIYYRLIRMNEPLDDVLRDFLKQRSKLRR